MKLIDPAVLQAKDDLIRELTDALAWWNMEAEKLGFNEPTHNLRHCYHNARCLINGQPSLPNLNAQPRTT